MFAAEDFASWWREACDGAVPAVLEERVRAVHHHLVAPRLDLEPLRSALESLLAFLAGEGRTSANCRTAEAFFCLLTAEHTRLVERLPAGRWQDLVDDLGIDLAASLDDPDVADRAGTSPEKMLERARALASEVRPS